MLRFQSGVQVQVFMQFSCLLTIVMSRTLVLVFLKVFVTFLSASVNFIKSTTWHLLVKLAQNIKFCHKVLKNHQGSKFLKSCRVKQRIAKFVKFATETKNHKIGKICSCVQSWS